MQRDEAPIRTPCSADWAAMTGDDARRFCSLCNQHVHNLSAMTEADARAVVAQEDVCVRYTVNPRTQAIRHRVPRRFAVRALTAATLTAGLALPAAAAISKEPGQVGLLQRAWSALTDWRSGPDELVLGGLQVAEVPTEEPAVTDEPADEPVKAHAIMGDLIVPEEPVEPVEPVLMGYAAPPVDLDTESRPAPAVED